MGRSRWTRCGWFVATALLAGCADNPMVIKGQVQNLQQQQLALTRQNQEIQDRASALDRDNQELQANLAQSKQKSQVLDDQLKALREQLGSVTSQLAQAREEKRAVDGKIQAMNASLSRQGGVTITPNNSLSQALPTINLPDVQVMRWADASAYDVLWADALVVEEGAITGVIPDVEAAEAEAAPAAPRKRVGKKAAAAPAKRAAPKAKAKAKAPAKAKAAKKASARGAAKKPAPKKKKGE